MQICRIPDCDVNLFSFFVYILTFETKMAFDQPIRFTVRGKPDGSFESICVASWIEQIEQIDG